MKKVLSYIAVALLFILSSCSLNPIDGPVRNGVTLRLTLNSVDMKTKASEPGVDAYNENAITKLDCFFYTSNSDDAQPEVALTGVDFTLTGNVAEISVSSADINTLFSSSDASVYVYVVANASISYSKDNMSVNQIKASAISASFDNAEVQPSFVMDGKTSVSRSGLDLSASVELTRSAAKIDALINTSRTITAEGATWTPDLAKSTISFYNGVNRGAVDGSISLSDGDLFNCLDCSLDTVNEKGLNYFKSVPVLPFYSYPRDWSDGASPDAYFILTIYWSKDGAESIPTYYQLTISEAKNLLRNNLYKAIINVNMLGSKVPEYPVTLSASYIVLNVTEWVTVGLTSEMVRYKYLVVDQNKYVLNNQDMIVIPFYSSDDCEIASVKVSYDKPVGPNTPLPEGHTDVNMPIEYKNVDFMSAKIYNDNGSQDKYSVDNDSKTITLTHVLNNDMSSTKLDYVPYTFTIILQHRGDAKYQEEITVIQYPAMYVIANTNYYYANNGNDDGVTTNGKGAVFVNGVQGTGGANTTPFGNVYGLYTSSGTNSNPNMYTIVPTVLSDKYIIGDPRESSYSPGFVKNDESNWKEATRLDGATDTKKVKHPLRTNSSAAYANMVAPRFRVASSYIVTTGTTKREQRCASYQEDGYPAGRWRVPTFAEVELVANMTIKGMIPKLFNTTGDTYTDSNNNEWDCCEYHCAQGTIYIFNDSSKEAVWDDAIHSNSVRCVYDEWYWGTDKLVDKTGGGVEFVSMEGKKNSEVKGTTQFIWAD